MKVGKIPEGMDPIEAKKKVSSFLRSVQQDSKPNKCILCGNEKTSFCNSHSVPRMCLKNIAVNGKVLQANELVGAETIDITKGVNNSGTFHFICNECDSKSFQDYENPNVWTDVVPTDKVLAQIALKDVLLMLSKRNVETVLWQRAAQIGSIRGMDYMKTVQELDIRDYMDEMELYKSITVDTNEQFRVVFYEKLSYTVPIATQTALVLDTDFEGNMINDIFDTSEQVRIQNLHVSIFPLEEGTAVIMFYHRRDKNYRRFHHQFNCLSHDKKLEYINYWIFKYTENYFFSPGISKILEDDEKLQLLSQENYGLPNLGYLADPQDFKYRAIQPEEITNLLLPKHAVKI